MSQQQETRNALYGEIPVNGGQDTSSNQQEHTEDNQNILSNPFQEKKTKYILKRALITVTILLIVSLAYIIKVQNQKRSNSNKSNDDEEVMSLPKDIISELFSFNEAFKNTNESIFGFEKLLWIFQAQQHATTLDRLYYQNNKYFAALSGFEVKTVNVNNAKEFLSTEAFDKLLNLRKTLEGRAKEGRLSGAQAEAVLQKVALLAVTAENGGVMVAEYGCLTQTFEWLRGIKGEVHARRGKGVDAEFFAFYDPGRSSPSQKENIPAQYEVEKYMRLFPGLQSYFIVSKKKARFTVALLHEIIHILTDHSLLDKGSFLYYGTDNLYTNFFTIAAHRVLQRTQRFLDQFLANDESNELDKEYRALALDYYGVYTINDLASMRKFFAYFDDTKEIVTIQGLTKLPMTDWEEMIGRTFQITRLTSHAKMNSIIEDIISGRHDPMIRGSFLQHILFPLTENVSYIIENPQKTFVNETNELWTTLPKKIWVYWDKGIEHSYLSTQVCVKTLKRRAKESGFEVNVVTQANVNTFVPQSELDRIQHAIDKANVQTFAQSKPDMIRLALLIAHGGIYLDVSFLTLTNFDWLVNIGRYPSKYIYNRYGNLPKVFMHFHPLWGGNFDIKINTTINSKVQWQLPYENNFIAVEKGNQLIKDWLEFLLTSYSYTYPQFQAMMKDMKMVNPWNQPYLVPMDSLKYVIARKQRQIEANPSSQWTDVSEYYGIWSMSGHYSYQKYRVRNGLESFNQLDNTFIYRYSNAYVEGFHGRNFHLVKFYGWQNIPFSKYIADNKDDYYASEAHPESLFMTYMMSKDIEFYFNNGWKVKQ